MTARNPPPLKYAEPAPAMKIAINFFRAGSLIIEDSRINTIAMTTGIIHWMVVLKVAVLIMVPPLFLGVRGTFDYSIQISLAQKDQMAAQVLLHLVLGSNFK